MRLIPLLLVSAALVFAGCAKKDDGTTPPTGNTTTTTTTMTTPTGTTTTTTTTPPTTPTCALNETASQDMTPPGGAQTAISKTITIPAGCSTVSVTVTFTPNTQAPAVNNVMVSVADSAGTKCKDYTAPNPLSAATTVGPDACAMAAGDAKITFSGAGALTAKVTIAYP